LRTADEGLSPSKGVAASVETARYADPTPIIDLRPYERPVLRALQRNRWRALTVVVVLSDVLAITAGLVLATAVRFGGQTLESASPYGYWLALWVPLWLVGLLAAGLYDRGRTQNPAEELRRIVQGVTLGAAISVMASFSVRFPLSRAWALLAWGFGLAALVVGRRIIRKTIHALRRRGRLRRRALIIGADPSGQDLAEAVSHAPWEGLDVVGFVAVEEGSWLPSGEAPIVGTAERLRDLTTELRVSDVLVSPTVAGNGHMGRVVSALDGVPVDLRIAPGLEGFRPSTLTIHPLGDRALVTVERIELRPTARVIKRILDLVLGAVLLVPAAIVVAVCALVVRIDSPGPAFFRQCRVGLRGREFTIWKLRTMRIDAEDERSVLDARNEAQGPLFKIQKDPRVTRVGGFLRRTSLDELPQLINVLAGHMSLVGPRPPLPREVARYDDRLGRRLLVKPGITGLWQVSGRSSLSFEEYVRYDLMYVQNWSIALDFYILAKTIPAVLFRRGAC
jgi:exopolysaccharide biosynthesis polyprenyl glycosylphosphotransferase